MGTNEIFNTWSVISFWTDVVGEQKVNKENKKKQRKNVISRGNISEIFVTQYGTTMDIVAHV